MVKIEHSKIDLEQFAKNHYYELCLPFYDIKGKLGDFIATGGTVVPIPHAAFAGLLTTHLDTIVTGWPDELEIIKPKLTRAFNKVMKAIEVLPLSPAIASDSKLKAAAVKAAKKVYMQNLEKVFNYDKFVKRYDEYGAYKFTKNLGVNVCPYCNRQYTFTLNKKTGKTRPELDHFYNKASCLFFGLSFFNLVPSCHICNANLKKDKKFTNTRYLNPYVACFNDVLNFSIGVNEIDFINGKTNSFRIKQKEALGASAKIVEKAKRNANIFRHTELYNNHQDLVKELLQKAYHYTPKRRQELADLKTATGASLFKDKAEVDRFITGVYTEVTELGKRPMSKLIRDIGRELKFL